MTSHWMEIGEGKAYVECKYEFDSDGDLQKLEVYVDGEGKDIKDALGDQQIVDLEESCRAHAKADYEEGKWDTKIDSLIELMNAETERLTR